MSTPRNVDRIDRRSFLRGVAAGAAAAPLSSLAAAENGKSRVALAERDNYGTGANTNRKVVKEAVDALVKTLSGKTNVDEAWRTFVAPKETVALKFNGLFRNASTRPEVIWSVCRGLVDAGVAQEKIIVFDRSKNDFGTAGLKTFDDLPKVRFLAATIGWGDEVKVGSIKTRLSTILTKEADAVISIPRLKHHCLAGVTMAMKNHIGSIPNPGEFHKDLNCIAELNALPAIRKKTRLSLCDAMVGVFDQGPQFRGKHCTWQAKSLLASTDMVALDAVGAEMIRKARVAKGTPKMKPGPTHIAHAAEIGLGTADLAKIEIVKA